MPEDLGRRGAGAEEHRLPRLDERSGVLGAGVGFEAGRSPPVMVPSRSTTTWVVRDAYTHADPDCPLADVGPTLDVLADVRADIDAAGEVARRIAVAGEDGNAVAELMLARQPQRFLEVRRADDRQHRTEYLRFHDR